MCPIRDSAIEINFLTQYLNRKFTKKAMNDVYIGFSPTYALIYIIKIISQAVILIAHFIPTCFDPYGSS